MRIAMIISALSFVSWCHGQETTTDGALVEHRAVWAHPSDIRTPELVAHTVERVSQAQLNAIYVLVWHDGGRAAYDSALSPKMRGIPDGFDPLAALIAAAHPRGIAVHAWFIAGEYGWERTGHVFTQHPDWELQTGTPTGGGWYDLGKPQVREFEREVMLDCLRTHDVDGLHLDYIRFPGRGMCYCGDCQAEVQRRFGIPAASETEATFPIASQMNGNPLDQPTTARVLATFEDGLPAVTLNRLGAGEAVLLNWRAGETGSPAVTHFARRMLERFGANEHGVYQLRNSETTARYGLSDQEAGLAWLRRVGPEPQAVTETQLAHVKPGGTVVLNCQYLISPATCAWLEEYVSAGGHALFLDGPVFAIQEPALQRVLGMSSTASYFSKQRVITPSPDQDLIQAGPPVDLTIERRRAEAWEQFWRDCVTDLVRQVYRGAKAIKPEAWVSAAVFPNRRAADSVCQDWYGWLSEGIIDYVLPMAYTEDDAELAAALEEWRAFDPDLGRIIPGLCLYLREEGRAVSRPAQMVLGQRELCRSHGARGNIYFCLQYLSDDLCSALRAGPYRAAAAVYYPARR